MENTSKKTIFESRDVIIKEEDYKADNGRVPPRGVDESSFAFKGVADVERRDRRQD